MPDVAPAHRPATPALTRAQARRVDHRAATELGLPTIVLMEHAARALVDEVLRQAARTGRDAVIVAAGSGNNGGDGLAAARLLVGHGVRVGVVISDEPGPGDAGTNRQVVDRLGIPVALWRAGMGEGEPHPAIPDGPGRAIVVDCLFGTGLARAIEGRSAAIVEWINRRHELGDVVVSADVPSGLDADTGRVLGACVRADVTVTFVRPKVGMLEASAAPWVGRIVVAGIGLPEEFVERAVGEGEPRG